MLQSGRANLAQLAVRPPPSATHHPRYWSHSEISGDSRRAIRGECGIAPSSNPAFSEGENHVEPLEEGCGPVFAPSTGKRGVPDRHTGMPGSHAERRRSILLLIILLVLLFGGGGGYYGYSRWGTGGGLGIVGTVLLVVVVLYLFGGMHYPG